MKVFYLLVLSHLLTDFVLQGKILAKKKKESLGLLAGHRLLFLICAIILLLLFAPQTISINLVILLIIIALVHFLFDSLKNYLENYFPQRNFEWLILVPTFYLGFISFSWIYFNSLTFQNFIGLLKPRFLSDKLILIAPGYLVVGGGTYFVRRLLEKIPPIKEGLN